jgi:NAD-dependent histone deacetylase SIR2
MTDPVGLPPQLMEPDISDFSYVSDLSDLSDLSSPPASPQTPPGFYPSPPPSQDQEDEQPSGKSRGQATSSAGGQEPARKKRRVGPTPRSTQRLDLSPAAEQSYAQQQAQIELLVKTLRTRRKIVVIAGAGISTSAGSESPSC